MTKLNLNHKCLPGWNNVTFYLQVMIIIHVNNKENIKRLNNYTDNLQHSYFAILSKSKNVFYSCFLNYFLLCQMS